MKQFHLLGLLSMALFMCFLQSCSKDDDLTKDDPIVTPTPSQNENSSTNSLDSKNCLNGIYYSVDGSTATVTGLDPDYTGRLTTGYVVSSKVTYQGKEYDVTSIKSHAFSDKTELSMISLPSSITSIGEYAFFQCTNLSSITIPSKVENIGDATFSGCSSLKTANLPSQLKTIGSSSFVKCKSLTSISFPSNLKSIGEQAFNGSGLKELDVPSNVETIGELCFCNCQDLKTVNISGATNIGNSSFADLKYLKVVKIGKNSIIGEMAFRSSSVEELTIDAGCDIGEKAFWNCTQLKTLYLYAKTIGYYAFQDDILLDHVYCSEGLESIDDGAFSGCKSVTSIRLPSTLKSIGKLAFYQNSLSSVSCDATTPPTLGDPGVFSTASSVTLYVPKNCVNTYKNNSQWSKYFKDIYGSSN